MIQTKEARAMVAAVAVWMMVLWMCEVKAKVAVAMARLEEVLDVM